MEIGDRHFAAQDECRTAGEQADQDQYAAERFEEAGGPRQAKKAGRSAASSEPAEEPEHLLEAVA